MSFLGSIICQEGIFKSHQNNLAGDLVEMMMESLKLRGNDMSKFYITYGNDSKLAHCYSEIESDSFMHGREEAMKVTKGKFAFFYDHSDFVGQITKFNLTKVPLQPAESVVW